MNIEIWLAFVATAIIILIIPGPTIIYVIGQSLSHGRKATLPLTLGVGSGDLTCILFSLLGLSTLLMVSSVAFTVLKLIGAAYLIYLGVSMLKAGFIIKSLEKTTNRFNSNSTFKNAFAITALNPKGIIFHSAFMPQFIDRTQNVMVQLIILGSTFLILALINTLLYSLLADKFTRLFNAQNFTKWFNVGGGTALIGAGIYTLTSER